jgi:hypothetical protein
MTLVEMEAELGEGRTEIKRRRRAGMGWLPLTLVLLLCFTGQVVEGFTAYDCSNRSNVVEAYSLLEPTRGPTWERRERFRPVLCIRIRIRPDQKLFAS